MSEVSVLELLDQLCDLHLGERKRAHRLQPKRTRDETKRHLKKVALNCLFGYLKNNPEKTVQRKVPFGSEIETVLLEVYKLRLERKFEDADKLEALFNQLRKGTSNPDTWKYLKFIVALKNSADIQTKSNFGEDVFHFPLIGRNKRQDALQQGPLCYGDVNNTLVCSHYYTHFPRAVFQREFPELMKENEKSVCQAFRATPGQFLGPDCLFTTKFLLDDDHEQRTQRSLFGGLTQAKCTDLEVRLELPRITSLPELKIPEFKPRLSHSESEESGLGSECASMSSSVVSNNTSGYDDSIWENALSDTLSEHFSWEWRGYQPGPTERPFLTEAGSSVLDLLVQYKHKNSSLYVHESTSLHLVTVDVDVLKQHVLGMLTGVPSVLFPLNHERQCFDIIDGLHISGTFPEMLSNVLSEFMNCGTFYVRLVEFSKPPVLDSFYTSGLVFQAFCSAISTILHQFSAEILNIPSTLTLMELSDYLHRSMQQIRYLAQLCKCCDQPVNKVNQNLFPIGMSLLSYLYEETQMSASSPHYAMFLSILQTSCSPLILFLRDWIFHGIYRDFYGEFIIRIDENYLDCRDELYWKKAYTLKTSEEQGQAVPEFLLDIINNTVTCGKSINLLRICNPQHFLCNVSESSLPPVTITYSQSYIREIHRYCETYVSRMQQISRQITEDRQELIKRVEREKQELQHTARVIAQREISRLQGVIDDRKVKADAKKRSEFARLKKQMEEDLQRRSGEQEEEREADRQYIARINKEEDALTEHEIQLEKQARDDLIAYYTELSEEAIHRERVALWRIRRAQLENARFLFLEADAKRWQQELQNYQDNVDGRLSPSLPRWAEKASHREVPLEVDDVEEISIPRWAARELSSTSSAEDIGILDDDVALPNWALRADHSPHPHTRIVSGGGEDDGSDPKDLNMEDNEPINKIQLPKPSSSTETFYQESKPHIQKVGDSHVSNQSTDVVTAKPTIKMAKGVAASSESQEAVTKPHIKSSIHMSATKESDPSTAGHRTHLKFQAGQQVGQESHQERALVPRKQKGFVNISSETESKMVIKKPSKFGHISQVSNSSYVLTVPKLRRQNHLHANMESSYKDFAIRSQVRASKKMFASKESGEAGQQEYRPHIRILGNRNANTESLQVDENALIRQKFLAQNFRGHSSDSTVQKLIYGDVDRLKAISEDHTDGPLDRISFKARLPYTSDLDPADFLELGQELVLDIVPNRYVLDLGKDLVDAVIISRDEIEAHMSTPLSVLLSCSLTAPIQAQMSLVNSAIINYFTQELKVDSHFEAIKRFLLMADGDFAEILANILFEKLITNPLPQEMINPVFLNGALTKAIRSSIHSDDVNTKNLNFVLKSLPSVLLPNDPNSLKCLELRYIVSWPLTIVFNESCMKKYYNIFNFLLQIKRVVWVLKDVWHQLKRDAVIHKAGNSAQFRQLQLYRQEMQHFVKMMQGYITNQVIHVSWQEFQADLNQPIDGLDQLCSLHERFVDRSLFRCLLDNKAVKVMKIIQDIFCLILKFRSQLVSAQWQQDAGQKTVVHGNFAVMVNTFQSFHMYSVFLFKVVSRLSQKGYQPHLQELLLQLNFNNYYTQASD
ncbi:gamma-tubulin complex component 6-like [Biomphalaria glabrata]|uniref:Gamma-tubulin complex component 6 n=2 Tax=Biomphalaria glabrata TaxID=6526 RepID=A0A9W2ZV80_BIOGL|nr:gamma-tubulin complex component 6-like [Biomphalaria glabrata]XP_055878815.1 gamma-tubulin complex component 6-like [Biomphalaria glabrata]XP_055878817.1 gamma-tubulin complex component 6-like [Biomphalaria glabrata]XP_055878818.1 gamma-tubulin complex component 6-like [Biomphalaria glabrata]